MKVPSIMDVREVVKSAQSVRTEIFWHGFPYWVPARPEAGSFRWQRIKAAWLVFTGRADAVTWPCGQ